MKHLLSTPIIVVLLLLCLIMIGPAAYVGPAAGAPGLPDGVAALTAAASAPPRLMPTAGPQSGPPNEFGLNTE